MIITRLKDIGLIYIKQSLSYIQPMNGGAKNPKIANLILKEKNKVGRSDFKT